MSHTQSVTEARLIEAVRPKDDNKDATGHVEADYWANYGKERVYLNGLKVGDAYVDLDSLDVDGDRWTKVEGRAERDGDTITVEVGKPHKWGDRAFYRLVIELVG